MQTYSSSSQQDRRLSPPWLKSPRSIEAPSQGVLLLPLLQVLWGAFPPSMGGDLQVFRFWWRRSVRRHVQRRHDESVKELRKSRELLAKDRRELVVPMRRMEEGNHFSEMIRSALVTGYDRHGGHKRGTT